MDAELLKTCHREIGHIVFDANEKITTRRISNTWSLDSKQALEVLQKWLEEQKGQKKLAVEYVVRGIDKNGNLFFTLANTERMEKVSKTFPRCTKMLYSVEIASDVRPLNVVNDNEFSVMNIRLNSEKRQIATAATQNPVPKEAPAKPDPKPSKSNMFAMASKAPPVKEEKRSPPSTPATPSVSVKAEPKTASPPKASPKTQSPKKDTKKAVATGKGAISSFFSAKPGQSAAAAAAAPKAPIKQEPPSPAPIKPVEKETKPVKKEEKTRKRTHTDDDDEATEEDEDVIPNTPQEDRKRADGKKRPNKKPLLQRKKTSNPSKKSRILEICDSSSDDEMDGKEAAEQRRERLVEFEDEEMGDEPEKETEQEETRKPSLSPEKPVENDSNSVNRNRGKVKKLITKTYTDEKGYLITVKDYEMVSEDESAGAEKETATPTDATKPKAASTQGKASSAEKKETPPTPKTKQGSIMSFFAKKTSGVVGGVKIIIYLFRLIGDFLRKFGAELRVAKCLLMYSFTFQPFSSKIAGGSLQSWLAGYFGAEDARDLYHFLSRNVFGVLGLSTD
uniref:DNA polymerase delta subunit 3 n=2 Tax=Anopheles stephensi TaxID=30069 RepID=A0A182Y398_ANOST